jgi:hypothetical protein
MTREELIQYIKKNDSKYNYDELNINIFSDEELMKLKRIIEQENEKEKLIIDDFKSGMKRYKIMRVYKISEWQFIKIIRNAFSRQIK